MRLGQAHHLGARARGVDERVARAVVDRVVRVALRHLLEGHAERVCGVSDLCDSAAETDEAVVEGAGEIPQQSSPVTLGIDGDE